MFCTALHSPRVLLFHYSATCPRRMPRLSSPLASATLSPSESGTLEDLVQKPKPKPWLFVGLGNPGKKYSGTRHNVGFDLIDMIAQAEGISVSSVQFKALFGKGSIGNVPVMLAKPQTFMNASGWTSCFILQNTTKSSDSMRCSLLQIYDDLDLPFAKLRLVPKGGHGGHNGMRSVIDHLRGNRDFPRLRIGIGRPPGKMDPVQFVLRPFNKQEREELDFAFQQGLEAVRILVLQGFDKSATFVNSAKSMKLNSG